ncbi:MAG: LPS export ABC transporter periplasmic protein LptC [Deltaproteobacteria bacterium]|nr:LPS export ABC transporter periplasmic protein LptC [Deltaproteobacteria bacterium]
MRRLTTLLSFLLVFTVGSIAFSLLRNVGEGERQEDRKATLQLPKADMVMTNVKFVDSRQGKRNWVVQSRTARLFKDKNRAAFEGVHITFFARDGREMHLYSNSGELDTDTRDMTAAGDIRGRSSDGLEFFTSTLKYTYEKREITTGDPVKIVGSGFETEGIGMTVDVERETVELLNQVRATGN